MEYDIPQEHLLSQTSIVIKVAMYIANSWVLLIDQTGIKKSKVNVIAFMNLHCLYVVIVMMHWYECIYSNCHVKAVEIPWKQWSLLQKSFHPCLTIKSTQELAIYIGTLMTIDIQSSQPPCGIPSSTLCSSFSTAGVLSLSVDVLRLHCMFSYQDLKSSWN